MTSSKGRLVGAVLIAVVTLFAFEGFVTTFAGGSLLRKLPLGLDSAVPGADLDWRSRSEDERKLAAASNPGVLRLHADPRVGYVLRSNTDLDILGGKIRSDALGLRSRPRPMPAERPIVIAIAGASVPFGFGLSDEDTIANQLEEQLAASRGPDARPVVCRTVAMTRWSTRSAVSFLMDHIMDLHPDIVVYMSYPNELSDTDLVSESGHRECAPDPASPDPWLHVCAGDNKKLVARLNSVAEAAGKPVLPGDYGLDALNADLSPESTRRYDESAECLLSLARWQASQHRTMILMPCIEHSFGYYLLSRLRAVYPEFPAAPLFTSLPADMTLGYDPHPNARTARVTATLVAQALLNQGLVDRGAGAPLPAVPEEFEALRAPALTNELLTAYVKPQHDHDRHLLKSEVDFTTGRSVGQVYGGVSENGVVGARLLLLLAPGGSRIELELAPIEKRPDLYPLDVAVELDGRSLGVVTLTADGPVRASLPLPPQRDPKALLEVKLVSPRWVVQNIGNTFELASFRPLRIACAGD